MTIEDFKHTIESLGTDPERWPADSRAACEALLESSPEARVLLGEQIELDSLLQKLEAPTFLGLEARVLSQSLPPQHQSLADKLINWMIPESIGAQLWRPTLAACLPLVFGVLLGNFYSFGVTDQELALEYWDDELALLSFNSLTDFSDLDGVEF